MTSENIYNAINNLYNMDSTTWQEVLATLYNNVASLENGFKELETKFGLLLPQEVRNAIQKLVADGTLEGIINGELLTGINTNVEQFKTELTNKLDSEVERINAQLDDIVHNIESYKRLENEIDDTGRINRAIQVLKDNGGGTLYLPNIYFTSDNIQLPPRISLKGSNKFQSKIVRTTNANNNTAIIELINYLGSSQYGSISDLTITSENSLVIDCGILASNPSPYLKIENVNFSYTKYGIKLSKGAWLCSIKNVQLYEHNVGIAILDNATSCTLSNIYVLGAKEKAYEFQALTYSNCDTLCADFCKGIVYDFNFGSVVLNGCGAESPDATNIVKVNNGASVTFNNAYLFSATSENSVTLNLSDGKIILNNSTIGNLGQNSQGKLYNNATTSILELNKIIFKSSFNVNSTNDGVLYHDGIVYRKTNIYVGIDRQGHETYQDTYNVTPTKQPKMVVLNNSYSPMYTSNNESREWTTPYSKGDVFFFDSPMKNGHGGAISLYSPRKELTLIGTIEQVVTGATVQLSSLDLEDTTTTGVQLLKGMKVLFNNGYGGTITAIDYATKRISLYNPTGIAQIGDGGKTVVQHYASANKFAMIPIIHSGISDQRPFKPVEGQQFFDLTLSKPIWWTGSKWVDSNGVAV